jgi:hypothetical protein
MAVVATAVDSITVGAVIAVGTEVEGTVVLVVAVPPQAVISMAAMIVTGSNPAFLPIHLLFENIFFLLISCSVTIVLWLTSAAAKWIALHKRAMQINIKAISVPHS